MIKLRSELKTMLKRRAKASGGEDLRISYMPIILKATSLSLSQFPNLNATVSSDATEMIYHANHNIGVAMDTPKVSYYVCVCHAYTIIIMFCMYVLPWLYYFLDMLLFFFEWKCTPWCLCMLCMRPLRCMRMRVLKQALTVLLAWSLTQGLLVPVLSQLQNKSVLEIAVELNRLQVHICRIFRADSFFRVTTTSCICCSNSLLWVC